MTLKINSNTYFISDLDDTLYNELDFVYSSFRVISKLFKNKEDEVFRFLDEHKFDKNKFQKLLNEYYHDDLNLEKLLYIYKFHEPNIKPFDGVKIAFDIIKSKGASIGLLTDGRAVSQKNKIKALGLDGYIKKIIISEEFGSEKPNEDNYKIFMNNNYSNYIYVGDNFSKDFITPNKLGWTTIAIKDNGRNIHKQNLKLDLEFLPNFLFESWNEVIEILY